MKIEIKPKSIPYLPLTVLIEEGLFRVLAFWIMGFLTNDPRILIGISSTLFALIHLGNLREVKHTAWDAPKYLLNIGILGAMLGYIYLQYGFIFAYSAHLFYDLIVVGINLLTRKYLTRRKKD